MIISYEIRENTLTENSVFLLLLKADEQGCASVLKELSAFCKLLDVKVKGFDFVFELSGVTDDSMLEKIRGKIEYLSSRSSTISEILSNSQETATITIAENDTEMPIIQETFVSTEKDLPSNEKIKSSTVPTVRLPETKGENSSEEISGTSINKASINVKQNEELSFTRKENRTSVDEIFSNLDKLSEGEQVPAISETNPSLKPISKEENTETSVHTENKKKGFLGGIFGKFKEVLNTSKTNNTKGSAEKTEPGKYNNLLKKAQELTKEVSNDFKQESAAPKEGPKQPNPFQNLGSGIIVKKGLLNEDPIEDILKQEKEDLISNPIEAKLQVDDIFAAETICDFYADSSNDKHAAPLISKQVKETPLDILQKPAPKDESFVDLKLTEKEPSFKTAQKEEATSEKSDNVIIKPVEIFSKEIKEHQTKEENIEKSEQQESKKEISVQKTVDQEKKEQKKFQTEISQPKQEIEAAEQKTQPIKHKEENIKKEVKQDTAPVKEKQENIVEESKIIFNMPKIEKRNFSKKEEQSQKENNNKQILTTKKEEKKIMQLPDKDVINNQVAKVNLGEDGLKNIQNNTAKKNDKIDHTLHVAPPSKGTKYRNYPIEMPLIPTYVFANMDISPIRFAHALGMTTLENLGTSNNPFLLQGASGTGKTHFLHAMGYEISKQIPQSKILFTNGVRFSRGVQYFLERGQKEKLDTFFNNAEVLIIDDIHLTAVNEHNREYISQVLNSFLNNKKQIILSSKYPPEGLKRFEELVNFKLSMGTIAELKVPNKSHFERLIKKLVMDASIRIPESQMISYFSNKNNSLGDVAREVKRVKVLSRLIESSGIKKLSYEDILKAMTGINGENNESNIIKKDLNDITSLTKNNDTRWGNFGFFFPASQIDKFRWVAFASQEAAKEIGIRGGFNYALKSAYSTEHIISAAFKIANICDLKGLKGAVILGPSFNECKEPIRENFYDILTHMLEVMMIRCGTINYEDMKKPSAYIKMLGDILK